MAYRLVRISRSGRWLSKVVLREDVSWEDGLVHVESPASSSATSQDGPEGVWFDVMEEAPKPETDYEREARDDAQETALVYLDEIVEKLVEKGEASDDLRNDYTNGDSYCHENHVDRSYRLDEAAQVLSDLHRYIETDAGLWEGLEPEEAIAAQGAFTYGNAVYSFWTEIVEAINDDDDIEGLLSILAELDSVDEEDFSSPNLHYYDPENLKDGFPKPYLRDKLLEIIGEDAVLTIGIDLDKTKENVRAQIAHAVKALIEQW